MLPRSGELAECTDDDDDNVMVVVTAMAMPPPICLRHFSTLAAH